MSEKQEVFFAIKPSLRRAYFYALLYAGTVLYGRIITELDPSYNPIWWSTLGLLLVLLAFAYLKRWTTTYIITSEEIQMHSGILARRASIVPLNRVTNEIANQSFLERILGLVNLQIDTAGGNKKEIVFTRILKRDGLEAARIIRKLRTNKDVEPSVEYEMASGE